MGLRVLQQDIFGNSSGLFSNVSTLGTDPFIVTQIYISTLAFLLFEPKNVIVLHDNLVNLEGGRAEKELSKDWCALFSSSEK